MLKKRSKLLAVMLVFSFALTGVAYAYWTDQLEIHGTVKTGTLDVYFTDLGWEDSEGAGSGISPSSTDVTTQAHPSKKPEPGKPGKPGKPGEPGKPGGPGKPGKPGGPGNDDDNNGFVANTKVALKDRNDDTLHERETTSSILQIAVENAYPGYEATIKFKIKNGGSIPAKVEQVNVEAFEIIGNEEEPVNIYDLLEFAPGFEEMFANLDIIAPEESVEFEFTQKVKEGAENKFQGRSFKYNVTLDFAQWNKPVESVE